MLSIYIQLRYKTYSVLLDSDNLYNSTIPELIYIYIYIQYLHL